MNSKIYSNREFTELRKRINAEMLRRGGYRWMDPLSAPKVGEDRTPPLSLPIEEGQPRVQVDDRTYTINTPSEGSIEPTKNIRRPIHGDNPGGGIPEFVDNIPNSSAGLFTADELRNFIVGLSKIDDINLFYGRAEVPGVAFRDANFIEQSLEKAESDPLNEIADCICRFYLEGENLVMESFITPDPEVELTDDGYIKLTYTDGERSEVIGTFKFWVDDEGYLKLEDAFNYITRVDDPNGGYIDEKHPNYPVKDHPIFYAAENGIYVMPSGESDGEEVLDLRGLGPHNFFDDYGAPAGDGNYHPYNRAKTPLTQRNWIDQDNHRRNVATINVQGGIDTAVYGQNPRNPNPGQPYKSRPVFRGSPQNSCNGMCTGLCLTTCDNTCSMSCTTTCFSRCGNACFKAGTMIDTDYGPTPIELLKIGDMVLSQDGKYHRIYRTFTRDVAVDECIAIKCHGAPKIYTTKNHPFWVKKYNGRKHIIDQNGAKLTVSDFSSPQWINAGDISSRDEVCFRRHAFGDIKIPYGIAYMVGRYLGDGWKEFKIDHSRWSDHISEYFFLCCGHHECSDLEYLMDKFEIKYTKSTAKGTAQKYHLLKSNTQLISILRNCGSRALEKHIPVEVFNWDKESLKALIDGYFDADGNEYQGIKTATSISKELLSGFSIIFRMFGINPTWSEKHYPNSIGTAYIQGRKVSVHDQYIISINQNELSRCYSNFTDTEVWASVRTPIEVTESYTVYNISVEDDPTYYADGVLVHNCTATCGAECTGCSTMCYTSCKNRCENTEGYACVKAGAKSMKMVTTGGTGGEPTKRELQIDYHSCDTCSYSCQFYPNKKTTCWDSGCMGKCFVSCLSSCVTACTGGCINNDSQNQDYKTGKGHGCESNCTINCIGLCQGVCEGQCTQTCWHACKDICADNCVWECSTNCGSGCANGCKNGCTGCDTSCEGTCRGQGTANVCTGCGTRGGCTSTCQHDCNSNCIGKGCKSMCGIESAGACEANCRINCTNASCTALCANACADACTTCVNQCGWGCGQDCTSNCSSSCSEACGLTCTGTCEMTCESNCVTSCEDVCGACSGLCYSCVAMCIGICSVKCQAGCSSCTNQCGWWCDTSCNVECSTDCDTSCMTTCLGSCITGLMSETTHTAGPPIPPTSSGYPVPKNREEERNSFYITGGSHIAFDICKFYIEQKDLILESYIAPEPNIRINDSGCLILTCSDTDVWYPVSKYSFRIDPETGELIMIKEDDE